MKHVLLLVAQFCVLISFSQPNFTAAYNQTSFVPSGLLEAVSWTNTHMKNLSGNDESCSGIPQPYGVMGMHDNGKNYFIETGAIVAELSGISITAQKASIDLQILAYAKAFDSLMILTDGSNPNFNDGNIIKSVLFQLSEIPESNAVNMLAKDMQVYEILRFMNSISYGQQYGFNPHHITLANIFGSNYSVLSSQNIQFSPNAITGDNGTTYMLSAEKSAEFGPAIWNPADPCNFSSRSGTPVSAITIHTIQGTYAGAISWAQNCSSSVSYHYVVRSSDGQVTQMVLEGDKAWHVGSENPYTIGYEHEGYVNDPTWYTDAMYNSSAAISRDIIQSGYGINGLRTYNGPSNASIQTLGSCIRIKGHQHYPNQTHTDPGINWDWERYYRLINNVYTPTLITSATGTLYDTGGAAADYSDDEREFWLIQPANTQSITLDFSVFNIETDWDYLFIYDGPTVDDALIGVYTGMNSPGVVTSTGGSLLLEFRSDCATTLTGWEATFTSVPFDLNPPTTVVVPGAQWYTDDFTVQFDDSDNETGVEQRFYLASENLLTPDDWFADGTQGFASESFDVNRNNWFDVTGTFNLTNQKLKFNDINESNSNSYMMVDQSANDAYLYHWTQNITSVGPNQRAGLHFACDNPNLPNRGNSYFVYLREETDKLQLYSVTNDVLTLEAEADVVVNSSQDYDCKVAYNKISGQIVVYVDDMKLIDWVSTSPILNGNSISLRTGNCEATFDNIRVYKNRGASVNVPAGIIDDFNIESLGQSPTGKITSIVIDSAFNISSLYSEQYLLDFTSPTIDFLNDGTGVTDVDTFTTTTLNGNWNAVDIHSDIAFYEYAIGTLPNLDDIVAWTNTSLNTSISEVLSNPIYGQVYHISLRATNGAGLSELFVSDGQRYLEGLNLNEETLQNITVFPNPVENSFSINGATVQPSLIVVYDMNGKVILKTTTSQNIDVSQLAKGNYQVMIQFNQQFIIEQLIKL